MRVQLFLHSPLMDILPVHDVFERLAIAFELVDNGLMIRMADRDGHKDFILPGMHRRFRIMSG